MRTCRALLLLVPLLIPCLLFGQSTNAAITGVVDDPSKAVIVEAQVTAINTETGFQSSTTTNESGIYTLPGLIPGTYRVEVDKQGFQGIIQTGVVLHVQDVVEMNFHMALGSMSETLTVDATSVNVNTTDASVSTMIDRQFAENLPLNGRSFQGLLYLAPGVTPDAASANSYLSQGQFVVNGQRGDTSYWMVDGVSANVGMSLWPGITGSVGGVNVVGGTNALVSIDAMQEFRIETSSYAPEFGREQGGQISIQTRSGTNQYHGALFDYLRNGDLDANNWFADHNALPKPQEIQNDFGGVFGGSILKNRTFFFFSYEGLRLRLPQTFLGTVPDLASRAAAIPVMQPYFSMYPLPKPGAEDKDGVAQYATTFSQPGAVNAYSLRIDHQLLSKLNLFARYSHAPSSLTQRAANTNTANAFVLNSSITKTATAGATWTESEHTVDELRFNYSVAGGRSYSGVDSFGGGTPFPSANLFASGEGLTFQNSSLNFTPAFGSNMREWQGSGGNSYQHQLNFVNTLSIQKGLHSLKFGIDYRRLSPNLNLTLEGIYPLFDTMQHMEQGESYLTLVFEGPALAYLLRNFGAFAQDTWRVTDRLNLTYGLRWDVDFVPVSQTSLGFSSIAGFNPTNLSNLALAPAGTPPYSTKYGNIAPRIGGAYRLSNTPNWGLVARGGLGIFYGLASTEMFTQSINLGFYPYGSENVFQPNPPQYVPFPTQPEVATLPIIAPPNSVNGQTLFGVDPKLKVPYALEWNAALEQSLGKAQTLSLSYVGASDKRLLMSEWINNPNPNYASAYLIANKGNSNYQSLQLQFRRSLSSGFQALLSYSWSHSIDTGSYGAYTNGSFANLNTNHGDSDFDIRNAFSGALTYYVPAWKNNFVTRIITGGWSLHNIVQINSGPPIDINDTNPSFSGLSSGNSVVVIRPDVVVGQPFYVYGSQYPGGKAINRAAFTDPPVDSAGQPLRQGDLGRNALRAFGMAQWDFAAHRDFTIREGIKLQFRAELFNIVNQPNFGPFSNQFQSGNMYFGQATAMLNQYLSGGGNAAGLQNPLYTPGGPRSGELALKLVF